MFGNPYGGFNILKILNGLSKSLSIANRIIPMYQEVKPIYSNLKNAFGKVLNKNTVNNIINKNNEIKKISNNSKSDNMPTFFHKKTP